MTTFQDLPPQSRRSARQSERGEQQDPQAGFADFNPAIQPAPPAAAPSAEQPTTGHDAAEQYAPVTGRRARPAGQQGLYDVPAAEPLEYMTQGLGAPAYQAPEPQQAPPVEADEAPQFRVRDYSPEGRASGRRAAAPPLIEPDEPLGPPQLPTDLDYRTQAAPPAAYTPPPAPPAAPVQAPQQPQNFTEDAAAHPTLSRRELRQRLADDQAAQALLTGPQLFTTGPQAPVDPALLTGPQQFATGPQAPVNPALLTGPQQFATGPQNLATGPQAPVTPALLTGPQQPINPALYTGPQPPAPPVQQAPPVAAQPVAAPAAPPLAPPPAAAQRQPAPPPIAPTARSTGPSALATAPTALSAGPTSLSTGPTSLSTARAEFEALTRNGPPAPPRPSERVIDVDTVTPTFIEPELEHTGSWVAPPGHWSHQLDDDDDLETTVTREVGGGNVATTTSALVLPEMPRPNPFPTALNGTGEILLTGSIDLPRSLATGSVDSRHYDDANVDRMFDTQDREFTGTDSSPVSAIRAVSTHTSARGVISANKPHGNRMLTVLLITATTMAVGVTAVLIAGLVFNVF